LEQGYEVWGVVRRDPDEYTANLGDLRPHLQLVTANVLGLLGVQPALGRTFLPDEDQIGREHVVVLSDALWRRRFNSDPGIINRQITLNSEAFTVVGVMPAGFFFPQREAELWIPWAMAP